MGRNFLIKVSPPLPGVRPNEKKCRQPDDPTPDKSEIYSGRRENSWGGFIKAKRPTDFYFHYYDGDDDDDYCYKKKRTQSRKFGPSFTHLTPPFWSQSDGIFNAKVHPECNELGLTWTRDGINRKTALPVLILSSSMGQQFTPTTISSTFNCALCEDEKAIAFLLLVLFKKELNFPK
jgi:hypothetical protein